MNFHEGKDIPAVRQSKGSDRIQINSILAGASVAVLALVTGDLGPFGALAVKALVIAIPLLVTSSLAYTKLCYRTGEYVIWNGLGWWTHTLGYFLVIDATALLLASKGNQMLAGVLLLSSWVLVVIYSAADILAATDPKLKKMRVIEKLLKAIVISAVLLAAWLTIRHYSAQPAGEAPTTSNIEDTGTIDKTAASGK